MHFFWIFITASGGVFLSLLSHVALAQSPQSILSNEKKQGWSGTASSYFLVGEGKSSLNNINEDNDQVIVSLSDEPSDYDFSTAYPSFRINYNLPGNTYFSLGVFDSGIVSNSLIETQSLVEFSIHHVFSDESTIWASVAPNLPGLYKVWQDPYQMGKALEKTDTSLNVFSLGADYIGGSPLSISVSIGEQKIDEDNAGRSFRIQSNNMLLNNNQLNILQRGTTFGKIRASLIGILGHNMYIDGGLNYFYSDALGDANTFSSVGIDIAVIYSVELLDIYIAGDINNTDFESVNPVFSEKREEHTYNFSFGVSYKEPFDWNNTSFEVFLGTSNTESNINFYKEESVIFATGFSYDF